MSGASAVVFVPDDRERTGLDRPLMLMEASGATVLSWLTHTLFDQGVGRFFLACKEDTQAEAIKSFPDAAEIITVDENPADLLHVFLSTADEEEQAVLVIPGPVAYAPNVIGDGSDRAIGAYRAPIEEMMEALDEKYSLSSFLKRRCKKLGNAEGFYSISNLGELSAAAHLLQKNQMLTLQAKGVTIYDDRNCYVEPSVTVEQGATLLPGTILRGNTVIRSGAVIGPWATITDSEVGKYAVVNASQITAARVCQEVRVGPFAHIRPGTVLERGVIIGNFVEVKNTHIGEDTWASHLSYLGDAEIGAGCNLGCGTVTVNFDRVNKYQTTVGDNAFVGCHSALIAPVVVGNGAYIAAGSVITENVPDQALGISRAKQSNKKDWAAKHKKPSV